MELNNLLGLCLPTNNPKSMKEIFLPSLGNLIELREVCTFLINFQPPYTQNEVIEIVNTMESYGFKVKYTYTEYPKELFEVNVPIGLIRNDTARLMKDAEIYGIIDDDMSFQPPSQVINKSSGEQFLDIVYYMMQFPACGVVLVGGSLYRKVPLHHISIVDIDNTFLTYKGLFIKNCIKDCYIVPISAESVVGGDEEKIACAARINEGFFVAKMRGGRTRHYENYKKKIPGCDIYYWDAFDLVEKNATAYIRSHYNPEFKGNQSTIGGSNYYNVVTEERYFQQGGFNWSDSEILDKYTTDFSSISSSDLINQLKEIYNA